jgi:hypothetical protein
LFPAPGQGRLHPSEFNSTLRQRETMRNLAAHQKRSAHRPLPACDAPLLAMSTDTTHVPTYAFPPPGTKNKVSVRKESHKIRIRTDLSQESILRAEATFRYLTSAHYTAHTPLTPPPSPFDPSPFDPSTFDPSLFAIARLVRNRASRSQSRVNYTLSGCL